MIDAKDLRSAVKFVESQRDKPKAIRVSKWGRGRIMFQLERMQRVNSWTPQNFAARTDSYAAIDKELWYAGRKQARLAKVRIIGVPLEVVQ